MNRQVQKVSVHHDRAYGKIQIGIISRFAVDLIPKMTISILLQCFRDNVWTVLTAQANDHTPSVVVHEVKEIETWILRLLSTPVPIPGSTRIELNVLSPSIHDPLLFALPDHTRFSLVDFPLHLPLELLGKICMKHFIGSKNIKSYAKLKNMRAR